MRAILKLLIVVAVIMLFFGPVLLRFWRALHGRGAADGGDGGRGARRNLPPRAGEPAVGTYCPRCGAPIAGDARFCSQCGRDVSCIDV